MTDTTSPDDPARIAAPGVIEACRSLVLRYAVCSDLGRHAEAASCFSDDGELTVGDRVFRGRGAVLARLEGRPCGVVSRHFCSLPWVSPDGPGGASGVTYVQLWRGAIPDAGTAALTLPAAIGHYLDDFVLRDGEWKFRRRRLVWDFLPG